MALSAGAPPFASAGKNFWIVKPFSSSTITSVAVAAPGRSGRPSSSQAATRRSGRARRDAEFGTRGLGRLHIGGCQKRSRPNDPARHLGHGRITSSAALVRSVTSSAGRPPFTSASARGRLCAIPRSPAPGSPGRGGRSRPRGGFARRGVIGGTPFWASRLRQMSDASGGDISAKDESRASRLCLGPPKRGRQGAFTLGGHRRPRLYRRPSDDGHIFHLVKKSSPKARKSLSHTTRAAPSVASPACWRKQRKARGPSRTRSRQIRLDGRAAVEIGGQHGERACHRNRGRTTSPSRSRASGPPIAASGQTWIAAGTLPRGSRHPPVRHQRHPQPPVLQHRERGRQRMQFGHAIGPRPLERTTTITSEVNSPALKARLTESWSWKMRTAPRPTCRSGATAEP